MQTQPMTLERVAEVLTELGRAAAQLKDDETLELVKWLRTDYEVVHVLPDGSIACLGKLLFTTGVFMGVTRYGWERRFCYKSFVEALAALSSLKSEDDEPTGWVARRPER